jgi:hypothetical protein
VTQCKDNIDNDANGYKDLADPGCSGLTDTTESGYTAPPAPSSGIIVYKTVSRRDYYVKTAPDMAANGGIYDYTAAHGYPTYAVNVASPTGNRICYLYDPSAYITEWSLGGFDSPSNNSMAAWNPSTGKWYTGSANSFGNKRYNYLTCRTMAPPDTSLTASANGTTGTNITVVSGTPVTLTWLSRYGKLRQGSFTATNFSMTTFIPAHTETVSVLTCDPGSGGFDDGTYMSNLAKAELQKKSLLALSIYGSCWEDTQQVSYPDQTISQPYGGTTTVTPITTTTYTYTGTNINGSNSSSVTVTVTSACADGADNDADGLVDLADPGCMNPGDTTEDPNPPANPTLSAAVCAPNGTSVSLDWNDTSPDGYYLRLSRPGASACPSGWVVAAWDANTCIPNPDLVSSSNYNNYPVTPGTGYTYSVHSRTATGEWSTGSSASFTCNVSAQCADGVDNDGDGLVDLADPGCSGAADTTESPNPGLQCANLQDDDADGLTDLADPGCTNGGDNSESPNPPTVTLSATPSTINSGQSTSLNWSSPSATGCTFADTGAAATNGPRSVSPAVTSTYDIYCSNAAGNSAHSQTTVTVTVPSVFITADKTRVNGTSASPATVNLTWSAQLIGSPTCSMTKEDQKRDEIFYNETLAPDDITWLLDLKVFTNFKRVDGKGEHKRLIPNTTEA